MSSPAPPRPPGPVVPVTFPQLLLQHERNRPDSIAMREKEFGIWQVHTWSGIAMLVEHVACGLHEAGLRRGQHMAVIGANRPWLYAAILAAQSIGAVPVPLYEDAASAECVYPIANAEVTIAIVEDEEQVDKLLQIRADCPSLAQIFYDDPRGLRHSRAPGLQALDSLIERGRAFAAREPAFFRTQVQLGRADDVAAIFFTSGTTGEPKGVVHTHGALMDRAEAGAHFDHLTRREEVLAYLPPAWIGQNIFSYAQWLVCGYVVNCPESSSTVMTDLKEVGPTYYFAPPRVFEGLLTGVMIRMEDAGRLKRLMFDHFMKIARRHGAARMDGRSLGLGAWISWWVGNLLVYGPLRNTLGMSRIRVAYTAGEAIGPDLFDFFRSIGVNLKQLYGSTETAVFVCLQPDGQARPDTVGIPVDGVEIKVEETGEILVRSAGLLKEYYKNEAATAQVLTPDGWYRTNDAGFLDAAGHLRIIDRVKDVGRMSGGIHDGAMFAPKYVENKLKFSPYIKEAVAYGDARDKVCAMINIDLDAVGDWAERHHLPYASYADLAQKQEVYALIQGCVEKVNADLASEAMLAGSQISRFLILHKQLDADDGELTRTNKIRRGHIAAKYKSLVDALYSGVCEQYVESQVKFEDGRTGSVSATLHIRDARVFETSTA